VGRAKEEKKERKKYRREEAKTKLVETKMVKALPLLSTIKKKTCYR
jgi:hypothetical protein